MAWRVISLQQTKQAELKICLRAYDDGKLNQVVDAIKYLRERLAEDPDRLGEPLFRYKSLDLLLYVAIRRPLVSTPLMRSANWFIFAKSPMNRNRT